jgi:hypothetical protein
MDINDHSYTAQVYIHLNPQIFFDRFKPTHKIPVLNMGGKCKIYTRDKFPWNLINLYCDDEQYITFIFEQRLQSNINKSNKLDVWYSLKRGLKYKLNIAHGIIKIIRKNYIIINLSYVKHSLDSIIDILKEYDPFVKVIKTNIVKKITFSVKHYNPYILRYCDLLDCPLKSNTKDIFAKIQTFNLLSYNIIIDNKNKNVIKVNCYSENIKGAKLEKLMHCLDSIYKIIFRKWNYLFLSYDINSEENIIQPTSKILRYIKTNYSVNPLLILREDLPKYIAKGYNHLEFNGNIYVCPGEYILVVSKNTKTANNDTLEYIVRCTLRGTSNNERNSLTSNYIFHKDSKILTEKDRGSINSKILQMIGLSGHYYRIGVIQDNHAFIRCVFKALDIEDLNVEEFRKSLKFNLSLCSQESNYSLKELKDMFEDISIPLDGTIYYRIFEELYNINIVIIEVNYNKTDFISYLNDYIWHPKENVKTIVILKNMIIEEGAKFRAHYQLVLNADSISDLRNTNIIENKKIFSSISEVFLPFQPEQQLINEKGKCIAIEYKGIWMSCYTRPYNVPFVNRNVKYPNWNKLIKTLADEEIQEWINKLTNKKIKKDTYNGRVIGLWVGNIYFPVDDNITLNKIIEEERCLSIPRPFLYSNTQTEYLTIDTYESMVNVIKKMEYPIQ